jgi:hypothetical protein
LNFRDGRILMQYLLPGLTIAGIHHPEVASEDKCVELVPDATSPTGDRLKVHYLRSALELAKVRQCEKAFKWALRKLHCYPIKTVNPGNGASIHYAGTLPFNREQKAFSLSSHGRLHGTQHVFVADGSGFRYVPAKGLTF